MSTTIDQRHLDHPQRDDEHIGSAGETTPEQALFVLDELRNTLAKWEARLSTSAAHFDSAGPACAPSADRFRARLDVVRDVLSIIGR